MPRSKRGLLHATSFRLALALAAISLVLFVVVGGLALAALHHVQAQAMDAAIAVQSGKLEALGEHSGLDAIGRSASVLQRDTDDWEVRLTNAQGRRLAGDLPATPWPAGFATRTLVEGDRPDEPPETIRAHTSRLADGAVLTLGGDLAPLRRIDAEAAAVVGLAALLAVGSALALGCWVSRRGLRRIDQMSAALIAFAQGDAASRVGAPPGGASDLDALAQTLDRMLEQIAELTQGMRRVSASVAHDLKRPLIRHNEEIAAALASEDDAALLRAALVAAGRRTDEVLAIFDAMLRLAELDAGAPGLPREPVDLQAVAERVVAAYAPRAEDEGRRLSLREGACVSVRADARLLSLMLANLVDNALVHTPPGAWIEVEAASAPPRLTVRDDGTGVPAADLETIFRPFHRGDAARTNPGSGLGLALVASAARAFRATAQARCGDRGFEVSVIFAEPSKAAEARKS